jgi:hypothetical protein
VNLSHRVQDGWGNAFTSYWKFWLVVTIVTGAVLWVLAKALSLIWPAGVTAGNSSDEVEQSS